MSYNLVAVTISVINPDGTPFTGPANLALYPSDFIWDTSTGQVVVVPPVLISTPGGGLVNPDTVNLLAMDNPTLSTEWAWMLTAGIPGLPSPIPLRKLTVNYAAGAAQKLTDLLATSVVVA